MSTNDVSSGGRLRRILDQASQKPQLREKIVALGALADAMTYQASEKFTLFVPQMLNIAEESGLLDETDFTSMEQGDMDELTEWFMDSANELAYLVCKRPHMPVSPLYKDRVGHAFLSWTVKNPRDREALCGIKDALDWVNVEYFDYTEHQLDDEGDKNDEIVRQLEQAVSQSQISLEIVSTEVMRPWVQYERSLLDKNVALHRFQICLESEKARYVSVSKEQEARTTRIDMSGGRSAIIPTKTSRQWMTQASDTKYFATTDFLYECYQVASQIRSHLSKGAHRSAITILLDTLLLRRTRDEVRFVNQALQRKSEDVASNCVK